VIDVFSMVGAFRLEDREIGHLLGVEAEIPLAPALILFGPNDSGKTELSLTARTTTRHDCVRDPAHCWPVRDEARARTDDLMASSTCGIGSVLIGDSMKERARQQQAHVVRSAASIHEHRAEQAAFPVKATWRATRF
jgi:hypothetical protein